MRACIVAVSARFYSSTLPRNVFSSPRFVLPSRRLFFELLVGLVGMRFLDEMPALMIKAWRRASASSRFFSWLRKRCALMTITPSLEMRLSASCPSFSLYSSGNDDALISKRRWIAVETLLTLCLIKLDLAGFIFLRSMSPD